MKAFRVYCAMSFVFLVAFLFPLTVLSAESPADRQANNANLPAFLKKLGKEIADFKTLSTDFIQEKEMALFKKKLVLRGRIYLRKPNTIAWHVDSPVRYSVLITDKVIRQWDEDTNRVQEISLTQNPVFQNVLSQLTVWFSGDYTTLLETNTVRLVKIEPLTVEFIPHKKNIAATVIQKVTISFREDRTYLKQIRIHELSGDITTIIFTNTLLNAPLDQRNFEVKGHE